MLNTLTPFNMSDEPVRVQLPNMPRRPMTIDDTGLSLSYIADLVLRALYVVGELTGHGLSEQLMLPYEGILDQAIAYLRREQMVEIKGADGVGERSYRYQVTNKGVERAKELGERSQYLGPAPVTLKAYTEMMARQTTRGVEVDEANIRKAFSHLVINEALFQQLGPAITSGRSIFLYGHAGNGKTAIAEAVAQLLSESIFIPHAIVVDGQVIKVFDPIYNEAIPIPPAEAVGMDRRWMLSRRPVVVAGGELTLEELDMIYDPISKYYEAPLQMKANGGVLLIDDFGRQRVLPQDLLNRWIVPLEKRVDYLTLHTGKKLEVPFDQLIIFSTNIEPRQLVDEAFLRRIRYKIEISNPSPTEYREIMRRVCRDRNVPYSDDGLRYLLTEEYPKRNLEMRAVHPRDLIEQLIDIARFTQAKPVMSRDLLAAACKSYFVGT
ncbi:MAG: ATP-binding protein [Chloroflexaceae bacterium]|jgi:predicted ATPase with chaperone activity|nr:ATP-binding protein [Chloroflexaceae bacterium]